MRCRELISDEEFLESKNELTRELAKLDNKDENKIKEIEKVVEISKKTFSLACHGRLKFIDGDNETKRNILNELGSNWTLEDKKLEMLAFKWLLPIQKSQTLLNEKIAGFELMKMPENKRRSELLELLRPLLRRGRDSNPRYLAVYALSKRAHSATMRPLQYSPVHLEQASTLKTLFISYGPKEIKSN